jgi:hypothetical protein
MRRRPVGRCDRRPPGLPGGPLPGQQPHRGKRRPSQAHQGQALAGRRPDRVRLGRDPQPRHRPGRPAAGGWPAASASRKAAMAVGHPGPGDRLAPAHQRRRRPRSWPATSSSGATPTGLANEPSPSSRPSATASPSNPPPNTRRFTFQDSSAPGRGLMPGGAGQLSVAAVRAAAQVPSPRSRPGWPSVPRRRDPDKVGAAQRVSPVARMSGRRPGRSLPCPPRPVRRGDVRPTGRADVQHPRVRCPGVRCHPGVRTDTRPGLAAKIRVRTQ